MPDVVVTATVAGAAPDEVFSAVADFGSYAEHTDTVRKVVVTAVDGGAVQSAWEVNFRNGVLAWTERDVVDPVARRIRFEQVDGDFAVFTGAWSVEPDGVGSTVRFTASFDLGMPSLAPMIDPIAVRTLVDNVQAILGGLLGPRVSFS
jgi:ribosome-associated toxin RatA of RatAB toxin-antitoxin module